MNEQEQFECQGGALTSDAQQNHVQGDDSTPETTATTETLLAADATFPTNAPAMLAEGETEAEVTSNMQPVSVTKPAESATSQKTSAGEHGETVEVFIEASSQSPSDSNSSSQDHITDSVADPADKLGELLTIIQTIAERVGAIEMAFPILRKDVLSLTKSVSGLYTTTTDRMHAKIEKYDRGLEQAIAKPYLLSIAKIGDALRRSIVIAEANPEKALEQLQSLRADVRVPLWNAGLRVIEIEPGVTLFNPRLHDGVDIVATGDQSQDGIVESVIETGYLFAPETDDTSARQRVFRAALVRVFKFDKTLEEPVLLSDDQPSFDDPTSSTN